MKSIISTFFYIFIFFASSADAVQVNFSGTIRNSPPCTITGDTDPIVIDFGDIGINEIGTTAPKYFSVKILCTGNTGQKVPLFIGYDGLNAGFDYNALQTSKAGLGILLRLNDTIIIPDNSDHKIELLGEEVKDLSFNASLVKNSDPSLVLYEGEFSATGTVEMRYP